MPKGNRRQKKTRRLGRDRDSADEHRQQKRPAAAAATAWSFSEKESARERGNSREIARTLALFWSGSNISARSLAFCSLCFLFFPSFFWRHLLDRATHDEYDFSRGFFDSFSLPFGDGHATCLYVQTARGTVFQLVP